MAYRKLGRDNKHRRAMLAKSLNTFSTQALSLCKNAYAFLLETKSPFLPYVIILSTNFLTSLARVSVVSIDSFMITAFVKLASIARLCLLSLPNFL